MTRQAVIVGGGVAGAAAACLLATAGQQILLIERERTAKPKVCGEFLSCAAQSYIRELGVDLSALGALPIGRVRLAAGRRVAEASLPFQGLSLPRHVLDEALLARAAQSGAEIWRDHAVREINAGHGVSLLVDGMGGVEADALFLASGKHDVRGGERPVATGRHDYIGLKGYFDLPAAQSQQLSGYIELAMFKGGYAGLQLVGAGRANLSLLVTQRRFALANHNWHELLQGISAENALLGMRLANAVPELERPMAIFRLPFGYLHSGPDVADIYRLGDQMACMPSFSGDGMSIALHSAFLSTQSYLSNRSAELYHRCMRRDLARQFRWGQFLSGLIKSRVGQHMVLTAAAMLPPLLSGMASLTRLPATSEVPSHLLSRALR
jgi:flavin-dependent dehydrogenase